MNPTTLQLPARQRKPRTTGLTMMVDGGAPTRYFRDVVESTAEYLDLVKFGWGTALVTPDLAQKIEVLRREGVDFYFGGTLFEKYALQGRLDEYRQLCRDHSCRYVEVSNGTVDLSNTEKASFIQKLAGDFLVISEVGFKDAGRSLELPPSRWIEFTEEDLAAGASLVTLEARESGRSGICRPDGQLRVGLIEDLLSSGLDPTRLLFEAPTIELQSHFVRRIGPDVNLGNVAVTGLLGLETIRLGLRSDTLTAFERGVA